MNRAAQSLLRSPLSRYRRLIGGHRGKALFGGDGPHQQQPHAILYHHPPPTTTTCRSFHASSPTATTIVCVRKNGRVCLMGDGMVSQGSMIVKGNATKIRRIEPKQRSGSDSSSNTEPDHTVLVGFAGSTADAFTLLERLEGKLDEFPGQLARSCVELAKGWRTDKYLRRLEASIVVADATVSLELTGNGDVLESNDGILGVGSGSPYAIAAARALVDSDELSAEQVAQKAMTIASNMCVHTNDTYLVESIDAVPEEETK